MDGVRRLIDFRGHAKRGEYWAISVAANFASLILTGIEAAAPQSVFVSLFALICIFVVILPIHIAVSVRRLHDRGRSGWWAGLLLGVPFVGGAMAPVLGLGKMDSPQMIVAILIFVGVVAWAFVELGVLPGKTKGNRYLGMSDRKLAAAFD